MIYKYSRNKIRETLAYKNATKIQQILVLKRFNMIHINHSVNVCMHKGYESWSAISGSTYLNKMIVKELYELIKK
jgi:hypothetical protein